MQQFIFSLIIPTYNAENIIKECFDSIAMQGFDNYEAIIVDGHSTDNTLKIVQQYAEANPRLRFVSENDNGIYDAMNKGIQMAKGEWLYFMGADDAFINKDVLSSIAAHVKSGDEIIYGNTIWQPQDYDDSGEKSHSMLLQEGINHQRIFYNKTIFQKYGDYNTRYTIASDFELNIRLFCNPGIKKKYVDVPVAFYHSGGFSANKNDMDFWHNWKNILVKNFAPYVPKKEIYRRASWYCWHNLEQKHYVKAAGLFCSIFFHTLSLPFLKHSISKALQQVGHK